jgi:hypothetical protein
MTEDKNNKWGETIAPLRWNRKIGELEDALRELPEYQRDGFRAAVDAMAEFEDAAADDAVEIYRVEGPHDEEAE